MWAKSTQRNYSNLAARWSAYAAATGKDPWHDTTVTAWIESTTPLPSGKYSYG
jgi:hypothetical protein